jgi:hypothetical protein
MVFTGTENHDIPLAEASALTENYRNSNPAPTTCLGEYFSKTAVQQLLAQTGCVGMRIYYGEDTSGNQKLVIVGVNSTGNDLYMGKILEFGKPSPPDSSAANPLNS